MIYDIKDKMSKSIPQTLMQNLYYPASLGTGLVLILYKILGYQSFLEAVSDISNWFGLLLIVYFSLSYLANERWSSRYGWGHFSLDFVELSLLLFSFHLLGFFNLSSFNVNMRSFYFCLGFVPVLHITWNWKMGFKNKRLIFISISRILILFLGGLIGYQWIQYDIFVLVILSVLTYVYIRIKYKY
jgi:hypothetical protein